MIATDLRLAILVGGELPPGWTRLRYEGEEYAHIERRYDVADPAVAPYLQRRCSVQVEQDGGWSIWGSDGPRQYGVQSGRAPDVVQAIVEAERVAVEWMAMPMGSPWRDEPHAWILFAGQRWAATRHLVVREDGPRPWHSSLRRWLDDAPIGNVIVPRDLCGPAPTPPAFLPSPDGTGLSRDDREAFRQVEPLFAAGEVLFRDGCALVFRAGEDWPVAMVSLWVPDEPLRSC